MPQKIVPSSWKVKGFIMRQEFEAKGLGAFGGGNDSAVVWRDRVDAQDAYAAAAGAKAAALQLKEEAMAAKRTLLARLEAAIHALTAAENGSADAADTARAVAADLDDHVEARCCPSCDRFLGNIFGASWVLKILSGLVFCRMFLRTSKMYSTTCLVGCHKREKPRGFFLSSSSLACIGSNVVVATVS